MQTKEIQNILIKVLPTEKMPTMNIYIQEIVDIRNINELTSFGLNARFNKVDTSILNTNNFQFQSYRFSLFDTLGIKKFDGIISKNQIFINYREYCLHQKSSMIEITDKEFTSFYNEIQDKFSIQIFDSIKNKRMIYLKWKKVLPKAWYTLSIQLKPNYRNKIDLNDTFESTSTALISNAHYINSENCNCNILDPLLLLQTDGLTLPKRKTENGEYYWISTYLLFDNQTDIIGRGQFTWEDIDLH